MILVAINAGRNGELALVKRWSALFSAHDARRDGDVRRRCSRV
jgi:hypothetical protein